jgi:hypothetical protein
LVRGNFTSDNLDEVGDIITREATVNAIPKYRQWGNIRYMHMPKPVATVTRIGEEDDLNWNEVEIKVIDPDAVFQVKNGLLKALSVGIIIRSFEDITIDEETGGWIINSYDLAEISLVDHPANYDARLFLDEDKVVPVTSELRQMVAKHGFTVVSKALGRVTSLKEDTIMEELEKDLQPEEELEEEAVEVELEVSSESEEEEEVVEASLESEEEEEAEEEKDLEEEELEAPASVDASEEEEEVIEASSESEEEEIAEAEEEKDIEEEEEVESAVDNNVESAIEEVDEVAEERYLTAADVEAVTKSLLDALTEAVSETEPEAQAEPEPAEQVVVERAEEEADEEDEVAALKGQLEDLRSQVTELTEKVADLMKPAKRKAKVQTDALPHESAEEISNEDSPEDNDMLKSAVKNYLGRNPQVVIRERQ